MDRQIDCPNPDCNSERTVHELGTAYERRCLDCRAVWDVRDAVEVDS